MHGPEWGEKCSVQGTHPAELAFGAVGDGACADGLAWAEAPLEGHRWREQRPW
ncbi:hypothetical protein DAEQUDRAFT_697448, partial [Daedalea quercina L-15889]